MPILPLMLMLTFLIAVAVPLLAPLYYGGPPSMSKNKKIALTGGTFGLLCLIATLLTASLDLKDTPSESPHSNKLHVRTYPSN